MGQTVATLEDSWTTATVAETLNLREREASAVTDAWDSLDDLVEAYKAGDSLKDPDGIGFQTSMSIDQYLDSEFPEAQVTRRENDNGIATEFGTNHETNEEGELLWWFVCPRCSEEQTCRGAPQGFAGRTYVCYDCSWVSVLSADEMDDALPMSGAEDAE